MSDSTSKHCAVCMGPLPDGSNLPTMEDHDRINSALAAERDRLAARVKHLESMIDPAQVIPATDALRDQVAGLTREVERANRWNHDLVAERQDIIAERDALAQRLKEQEVALTGLLAETVGRQDELAAEVAALTASRERLRRVAVAAKRPGMFGHRNDVKGSGEHFTYYWIQADEVKAALDQMHEGDLADGPAGGATGDCSRDSSASGWSRSPPWPSPESRPLTGRGNSRHGK